MGIDGSAPVGGIAWGTVGDWVSSSIALVAILLTMYMWRRDRQSAALELARRAEADEREAAGQVNCWLEHEVVSSPSRVGILLLVLQNGGGGPVYEWSVTAFVDPPAQEYELSSDLHGVIPPHGGRIEIPMADSGAARVVKSEIGFRYTLANGQTWCRTAEGELQRL